MLGMSITIRQDDVDSGLDQHFKTMQKWQHPLAPKSKNGLAEVVIRRALKMATADLFAWLQNGDSSTASTGPSLKEAETSPSDGAQNTTDASTSATTPDESPGSDSKDSQTDRPSVEGGRHANE